MAIGDYDRINWVDAPSKLTPISSTNLNKMDSKIKELDSNTTSSDDLVSSNLGTVTTHKVFLKPVAGVVRYRLSALSGTWIAETDYILCSIPSIYRPSVPIDKTIILRTSSGVPVCANLYINTTGAVYIKPKTSMTALSITIDELYFL